MTWRWRTFQSLRNRWTPARPEWWSGGVACQSLGPQATEFHPALARISDVRLVRSCVGGRYPWRGLLIRADLAMAWTLCRY